MVMLTRLLLVCWSFLFEPCARRLGSAPVLRHDLLHGPRDFALFPLSAQFTVCGEPSCIAICAMVGGEWHVATPLARRRGWTPPDTASPPSSVLLWQARC